MSQLSEQARAALAAFQSTEAAPSEVTRNRTWAAIQERAAAGDLGPLIGSEPAVTAAAGAGTWSLVLKGVGLGVFATAVVIGAWSLGRSSAPVADDGSVDAPVEAPSTPMMAPVPEEEPELEPATVPVERVSAPPPASAPDRAAAPVPTPSDDLRAPTAPQGDHGAAQLPRAGQRPKATAEHDPEAELDPLAAELALMTDARKALKADRLGEAVRLLDRHAKRFPQGTFARERDLSRVRALCDLGKTDRARSVAAPYLAQPDSVMASKLAGTCAAD